MNQVILIGNITGDIYYDKDHEFMRLILMAGRPRIITGLRVVLTGRDAGKFYPCVRRGSEIGLVGYLKTRAHGNKFITEIVVNHFMLLRNTNLPEKSSFLTGTIQDGACFTEGKYTPAVQNNHVLSLTLYNETYPNGVEALIPAGLAELVYPYLRIGSVIAVDGDHSVADENSIHVQHIALLQNVNWAAHLLTKS